METNEDEADAITFKWTLNTQFVYMFKYNNLTRTVLMFKLNASNNTFGMCMRTRASERERGKA